MKQFLILPLCAALFVSAVPRPVEAAQIKRACLASDRDAATRQRCTCIQRVANDALSRSDRRTVAAWFADPHQAQVVKMSQTAKDDALWDRYQAFGRLAGAICR